MHARPLPRQRMISALSSQRVERLPGELKGSDLVVEKVSGCSVLVCDRVPQAQIDDVHHGSEILVGPCDGSVFVRDCSDCTIKAACAQLRATSCANVRFELFCQTPPSIESCSSLVFSFWRSAYPGLAAHLKDSALDLRSQQNRFADVYNFSASACAHFTSFSIDSACDGSFHIPQLERTSELPFGTAECPIPLPDGTTLSTDTFRHNDSTFPTSPKAAEQRQLDWQEQKHKQEHQQSFLMWLCYSLRQVFRLDPPRSQTRPCEGGNTHC